jgi:hypothetical protein
MGPRRFLTISLLTIGLLCLSILPEASQKTLATSITNTTNQGSETQTALVLNPEQYVYGARSCTTIAQILTQHDYTVRYEENTNVDLNFIRTNLSADILYLNTHAGHWDIDSDGVADTVVIATGEPWTNKTKEQYAFDFQQGFIVEGVVGNRSFIAFTPAFIQYYYNHSLPASLIFMATCEATADSSMADSFLSEGAAVYVGWTSSTTFWTNEITSVVAFRLLSHQLPIDLICTLIRSGGLYNWIFHSRLTYYGDGEYRLSQEKAIAG